MSRLLYKPLHQDLNKTPKQAGIIEVLALIIFIFTTTSTIIIIIIIIILIIIIIAVIISEETPAARGQLAVSGGIPQYCFSAGVNTTQTGPVLHCMVISILHLFGLVVAEQDVEGGGSHQEG